MPRSTSKKKTPDHRAIERALIGKAIELTEEHGVGGWSLAQAARDLGMSAPTAHRCFNSREELMLAVSRHGVTRIRDRMVNALRNAGNDPAAQYHAIAWCVIRYATQHRAEYQITFSGARAVAEGRLPNAPPGSAFRTLVDAIVQWQAVGFLRPGDPERTGMGIWAMIHGVASLSASGRLAAASSARSKVLTAQLMDALRSGIGVP